MIFLCFFKICYIIGTSFGTVPEGSALCYMQSILTNIFPLSSLFWTTYMAYCGVQFLNSYGTIKKEFSTSIAAHLICWIVPAIVTLLPLSTNSYGCYDEDECWCFLKYKPAQPPWIIQFWYIFSFYFWVWGAYFLYITLFIYMACRLKGMNAEFGFSQRRIDSVLSKMIAYPLTVLFCWFLTTYYDIVETASPKSSILSNNAFNISTSTVPCLQGFLTSLAFFITNYYTIIDKRRSHSVEQTEHGGFRITSNLNNVHNGDLSSLFSVPSISISPSISFATNNPIRNSRAHFSSGALESVELNS